MAVDSRYGNCEECHFYSNTLAYPEVVNLRLFLRTMDGNYALATNETHLKVGPPISTENGGRGSGIREIALQYLQLGNYFTNIINVCCSRYLFVSSTKALSLNERQRIN